MHQDIFVRSVVCLANAGALVWLAGLAMMVESINGNRYRVDHERGDGDQARLYYFRRQS